jgi:hypothetical protein
MIDSKKLHRLIGLAIAAPLLLWALTGIVFLVKPGYAGAYDQLSPKRYEIRDTIRFLPAKGWREIKLFRTVLGDHLIVNDGGSWRHLDPGTLQDRPPPSEKELKALISDAMTSDSERYGNIVDVQPGRVSTDTGVEITLDWSRVELKQRGQDTHLIDTLYKIHYLQWLGELKADKALGVLGILLLIALLATGLTLIRNHRASTQDKV